MTKHKQKTQPDFSRFLPFAKVDEARRMVYGRATDETPDVDREVVDYEATKRAVADYAAWRNVREMHGSNAAGVAEELHLNDVEKALDIGVHVVDEDAWQKVKAGVYKGFSIGGIKRESRVEKAADGNALTRITDYLLTEISLVDRPANPSATFSLVKREGGAEEETPAGAAAEEGGEGTAEEIAKEEAQPEEAPGEKQSEALTLDAVKNLVIDLLKELGLVREAESEISLAAQVEDLKKAVGKPVQSADLKKLAGEIGSLAKAADLFKVVGDLAKVVQAVDTLDERLEAMEKMPAGAGPVLREIGLMGIGNQTEAVLKSVMNETNDPLMKQLLGQKLAEMQIQAVQQNGQTIRLG